MTPEQCAGILIYANQIDPLVASNDTASEVWWEALARYDFEKAKWCVKDYYANTMPGRDGRVQPLTPALLRHRIGDKDHLVVAQQRALEPPARHTSPMSYRERFPEEFDQLVQKGQDDYRAMLRSRDITPHTETCPDCQRDIRARAGLRTVENAY